MIHARNFQRSVPGFRIVSVADPVEEAAASACRELEIEKYYLDYKQALEDEETDAVVIVSPTKYHCEIAVCAAKHRKDILLEKPMDHECPGMCANHGGSQGQRGEAANRIYAPV